ncbi:MAG: hypothetical protein H6755_02565 [Candidatus Omnitrophica bacterium]|nr:hypothetical protein [Candidatus Omnitrophota bacterium]MCB9747270.1 hypothetical protein [Candidatus Omnitrophota bacterium]
MIILRIGIAFFISLFITSLSWAQERKNFQPKHAQEKGMVELIPLTLKEGMESQLPPSSSLDSTARVLNSPVFVNNARRAQKAGVDIVHDLDHLFSVGYSGYNFFILFYNLAKAQNCPRDYVIQTVRLDKSFYDAQGKRFKFEQEFLVEAIKLNSKKQIKRADEHRKRYSLGDSFRRDTQVFFEIGCGEVPGYFEGESWPKSNEILYYLIKDYTSSTDVFNQVKFDASAKYQFSFVFDRLGNYSYVLPEFLLK